MTPLLLAVTSESQNADVVRLLLAKGAKADVTAADGQNAWSWARKWGAASDISRLVTSHGGRSDKSQQMLTATAATVPAAEPSPRSAKEGAESALALLQRSNTLFVKQAGCASCHHQLLSGLFIGAARERGLSFDQKLAAEQLKSLSKIKLPAREGLLQRMSQGVSPIENSLFLVALGTQGYPADELTDALFHDVAGTQRLDGSWSALNQRPPMVYTRFSATAYALHMAAGTLADDPVSQHGVAYLVETQHDDGSWHVRSRSVKFQPYFNSGFPYEHDQWISAAGTNWAGLALTVSVKAAGVTGRSPENHVAYRLLAGQR